MGRHARTDPVLPVRAVPRPATRGRHAAPTPDPGTVPIAVRPGQARPVTPAAAGPYPLPEFGWEPPGPELLRRVLAALYRL